MTPREVLDRVRLARTEGVGPVTYRRLLHRFSSAAEAIDALPGLARAGGRRAGVKVVSPDIAERELEQLGALGGRMLVLGGPDYPPLLATLDDAPAVISVLGSVEALQARAVAVVGGRNASANGRRLAEILSSDLALSGLVVVSGMARGVDTAAHVGALRTGRTVAAVAGGLDVIYPPENAALQRRVAEGGAVVAEAPLGTAPRDRHFPRRNRIIAGLSLGVVVVEAAPHSGSLITARMALEANRELFAVPGSPLDPRCLGSNDLIRQGATLTETARDVLDNLPDHARQARLAPPVLPGLSDNSSPLESELDTADIRARVVQLLSPSPTPVDDLVRRCQLSASAVMAVLLELELAQRVEMLPGNRACLIGQGLEA